MAYQNVGKPRIFVDYYQYAHAIGIVDFSLVDRETNKPAMLMNPLKPVTQTNFTGTTSMWYYFKILQPMWGMNFYAMLGHNMGSVTMLPLIGYYQNDVWGNRYNLSDDMEPIINIQPDTPNSYYVTPIYNGFSIWKHAEVMQEDGGTVDDDGETTHYTYWSGTPGTGSHLGTNGTFVGAFTPVCGRIYEFEHAPDVKVSMERESDGVKSVKTIGGSDISNSIYNGPPPWPYSGNPWNLTMPGAGFDILQRSPEYAGGRMGRRVWNLKFSMLSDRGNSGSLFSTTENPTPLGVDTHPDAGYTSGTDYTEGYTDGDTNITYPATFVKNFWSDDSFMGLVYQKTLGFQLPFIFQPDSNNNSADQFAIAKVDAKSLKITQTSFKKYDIKLKIREVW